MKPIELTPTQWEKLREQLKHDHKPSVMLIRDRMSKTLGFTDRTHRDWIDNPKAEYEWDRGHYEEKVMLDFYNEKKRTLFILKYSEFLNEKV